MFLSTSLSARPDRPASALRHRWRVLAAGVIANAAFSLAFAGIPSTAVLLRGAYGLDNAALGLALGLMGLGIALSELPWGLLTDRWGDRPVLLYGLGGTALALLGMALFAAPRAGEVPGLAVLGGGLLLVGLLGGSVNGASGRAVMQWFADGERGLAMSIRQTAVPLGGGLGALVLPLCALHCGFATLYALLAALCALAAVLCAAWVHEPPGQPLPPRSGQAAPMAAPLRDARLWRLVAGTGILCVPQFAVLSFGTVFLHDAAGASLATLTAMLLAVQLGAMVTRVWSGRWTDRHRNRPAYLRACASLSLGLFAALAALSWLAGPLAAQGQFAAQLALVLLLGAGGIVVSAWHGVAYAELATLAGADRAGTALGMANTCVFVACFLTPLGIPRLVDAAGWPLAWAAAAVMAALARPLLARAVP